MEKRIVIAGCRNYTNYEEAEKFIKSCIKEYHKTDSIVILSGACRGADKLGERFAKENDIPIRYYPAEWNKFGKAAGPIRNKKMISDCHRIICFWDGKSKGTASLIKLAKSEKKPIQMKYV